ncbi:MAG: hypothetical protein COT28_03595 [Methylobacterium sp. CG08_land_8_20_14_0_20_71_15]|uniref:Uncharacterized protein n=1 Tax=Methylobacterium jeotgali TaxID=381630 RepID=A0ABQ4T1F2_9HYPH|nr:MAG: hypothetical protein COT56_02345 [Methylobacterium sp. CG09_land_8_20_14_0_10_71_15]PIU15693.1 MAG: hypothetical protein COT28_03595 [Methylobacterium sp. CG08_land_8_20_14_0_20_71_15]GBU17249.1 hypothetical protein AwMethylo_14640 [Methylobacterium sp.]GJE07839.1 hypothetical protein AOPFMNJM_3171 [Methylobacterium jeotgali]
MIAGAYLSALGIAVGLGFTALAIPALWRADTARVARNRPRALIEGMRALLAIAAAAVLFTLALRGSW